MLLRLGLGYAHAGALAVGSASAAFVLRDQIRHAYAQLQGGAHSESASSSAAAVSLTAAPVGAAHQQGQGPGQQQGQEQGQGQVQEQGAGRCEERLVRALVYFRHGARTPVRELRGSSAQWLPSMVQPIDHEASGVLLAGVDGEEWQPSRHDRRALAGILPGGAASGQLTTLGRDDAVRLGARLRERYIGRGEHQLVQLQGQGQKQGQGAAFDESQVYIRSTNMRRTIETARVVAAMLHGQDPASRWPVRIATQVDSTKEIFYPNTANCSLLRQCFVEGWWPPAIHARTYKCTEHMRVRQYGPCIHKHTHMHVHVHVHTHAHTQSAHTCTHARAHTGYTHNLPRAHRAAAVHMHAQN